MVFKRRFKRLIGAVTDIVDTIRWALAQRRLAKKWHLPPEDGEDGDMEEKVTQ